MLRRIGTGGGIATRALAALLVTTGALAAVAYAATGPGRTGGEAASASSSRGAESAAARPGRPRPPRPLITRHPRKVSTSGTARFSFTTAQGAPRFRCRLDGGDWKACQPPTVFRRLAVGNHGFAVRTVGANGRRSRATSFRWQRAEPKPFSVEPQLSSLAALYPGAPAQVLPVALSNPNPIPIFVTGLRVSVSADPVACDSATNLVLSPSNASPQRPLAVPAGGTVSLPSASVSAPSIALRDLPVNQDACQGARLPLAFAGEAHG